MKKLSKKKFLWFLTFISVVTLYACGGSNSQVSISNGTNSQPASINTPIAVKLSSYEGAKSISFDEINLPSPSAIGISNPTYFQFAFAYADFFQEGKLSVIVQMPLSTDPGFHTGQNELNTKIIVLRKNSLNSWYDATNELLTNSEGCITSRKALVADFNGDQKPDVFFACHGYDGVPAVGKPLLAENQQVLMSRSDGKYDNIKLPFVAYGHGASAADIDGNGTVDLVVTNTVTSSSDGIYSNPNVATEGVMFVLLNDGHGNFSIDTTKIPAALQHRHIYSVELIKTPSGSGYDMFVGGSPEGSWVKSNPIENSWVQENAWFKNDGAGNFSLLRSVNLPNQLTSAGLNYGVALDFYYDNGYLYMSQIDNNYSEFIVQKINLSNNSSSVVYQNSIQKSDWILGATSSWTPWIYKKSGLFYGQSSNCPLAPSMSSICSLSFAP